MAFINKSALATGSTTALPVYASAVRDNLLLSFVGANETAPAQSTLSGTSAATTGWSLVIGHSATNNRCEIWQKIALGSDTMPTWNGGTTLMSCAVAEFSQTTLLDQTGSGAVTTTPGAVSASAKDGGVGRLIVAMLIQRDLNTANSQVSAMVDTYGGSGTANVIADNVTTSQNQHVHSSYCVNATTGSAADSISIAFTVANATGGVLIASFAIPPIPVLLGERSFQATKRAAFF